jgi:hypothetical protein
MTAQGATTTMAFIVVLGSSVGSGQVKTTVPDVVPGRDRALSSASRFTVRRSKAISKGTPSTAPPLSFCRPVMHATGAVAIRSYTRFTAIRLAQNNGLRRSTCRRPLKVHSLSAPKR